MSEVREEMWLDDISLVEAARRGDTQSFEMLTERYYNRIQGYLTGLTNDREFAADLTQQTFLDAFLDCDRLPTDRAFSAWLYRIARNNFLSENRRRRIQRFVSMNWLFNEGDSNDNFPTRDATENCAERILIQQVLDSLSFSLRDALLLSSLAGFPSQEVAEILHISPVAARQRISRAKEQFKLRYHRLSGEYYDASLQPQNRRSSGIQGW